MEYNSIVTRYNDNLVLNVLLFAEIESLRSRMREKEREVDDIRRSSLAPYRR